MRLLTLIIILVMTSVATFAQVVETRYYNNRDKDEEVSQGKAKYSETITRFEDGTVTTTLTNLKKNVVELSSSWKGEERVGKWVGLTGRGPEEMDYDFELIYTEKDCPSDGMTSAITDFFIDNEKFNYIAPKLVDADNVMDLIRRKLRYPAEARRKGIQGTVELTFMITEEGKVADVKVNKGVHKSLDKEAARMIRLLKFSSPPTMNGQPKNVCIKMPLRFKLA